MKLIVGLGNPGSQYDRTRHNAGFLALDRFAQKNNAGNYRVAHESFMADVLVGTEKVLLLKPQTYMNLSGRAVASAVQFYKLTPEQLLVLVDDVALPAGTIRIRAGGSAGGHNGLRDIEAALNTQDYPRLRIGVDPPGNIPQKDYVLGFFTAEQKPKLDSAFSTAADAITTWVNEGIAAAMNRFNGGEKS
jgi:PTH1 family peptidyl-tRNA hydrolase